MTIFSNSTMIEPHLHYEIHNPPQTFHNPPRVIPSNLTATSLPSPMSSNSANYNTLLTALYRYMQQSNAAPSQSDDELAIPIDGVYAGSDEFRMYEFKIRPCTRAKAHDWTECPFAHPGEKARRRDPRRYPYSGTACTDFRKGGCIRGDNCEFAHGVFECWLHPTRYRTQACKDGPNCTRRVCFFAHSAEQLRAVSGLQSPRSVGSGPDPFEDLDSPSSPVTPIGQLVSSLRNLQLSRMQSMGSPRFGSVVGSVTPTRPGGPVYWEEEELVMERVESGRELRARMFERMSKDNPLTISDPVEPDPDVGWVTELVK